VWRRLVVALAVIAALAAASVYWFLSGGGIRLALERQASAWLGQPVRIRTAGAQIVPRLGIQLNDVRIGNPVRLALADVEVSTGLQALFSRRIEDAEILVSDSRLDLPLPFALPASGNGASSTPQQGGITVASIRAINLRNVVVASRGREIAVSAESALAGTRLELKRFRARSGMTEVDVSGTVSLSPRVDATLKATANRLDLDDLLALADAFTPTTPGDERRSGELLAGRLAVALRAARGTAASVQLSELAADVLVEGNRVRLSPASFQLFGGRYTGALNMDVRDTLAVTLSAAINNLDVAQLAAFGGVEGSITGKLSGNGRFTGRGRDMRAVLINTSGSGNATIADGTLRRLDLIRTVILFFGRPAAEAPASAGERFNRIAATFSIARQVVRSDSLTLQSQDVDLMGTGSLTIPTKALDGRANLVLSESLSSQAGTDFARYTREGNRIVLPAIIGGTLDQPRVSIDAAAAVQRGIRNEVERRLKGLLDRFKRPPQ
jgi:hypothetical protein